MSCLWHHDQTDIFSHETDCQPIHHRKCSGDVRGQHTSGPRPSFCIVRLIIEGLKDPRIALKPQRHITTGTQTRMDPAIYLSDEIRHLQQGCAEPLLASIFPSCHGRVCLAQVVRKGLVLLIRSNMSGSLLSAKGKSVKRQLWCTDQYEVEPLRCLRTPAYASRQSLFSPAAVMSTLSELQTLQTFHLNCFTSQIHYHPTLQWHPQQRRSSSYAAVTVFSVFNSPLLQCTISPQAQHHPRPTQHTS
jgi:hypothetical protein